MKLKKLLGTLAVLATTSVTAFGQYSGDPTLKGYQFNVLYNTYETGVFEFSTNENDPELLWKDSFSYEGNDAIKRGMISGWIRDGKLCGYVSYYPIPSQSYYKYVERDLETGEVTKTLDVDLSSGWENYFLNATYCPVDDRIYGYGFNSARNSFAFKTAPATNPNQAIVIKEVGMVYPGSICYNHETGEFVGIMNQRGSDDNYTNYFVTIDVNTGEMTEKFRIQTDYISDYKCTGGLIWVPARQAYLWNFYNLGQEDDVASQLLELDPTTSTSKVVRSFGGDMDFMYFIAEDNAPKPVADAPQPVSGVEITRSSTDAHITFVLPSKLVNESAISGNIAYTIYVDNVSVNTGSGVPGTTVNYETTLTEGTHFVRIVPSVNGKNGLGEVYRVIIGSGTPMTPENIILTETELTWEPVLKGINGIDLENVVYQVSVNNKKIADTSDTKLSMDGIVLPDADLASYQAIIYAVSEGKSSKAGYSNRLITGKPWTVPFTITPTVEQFNLMEQEDVDKDNELWTIDEDTNTGDYVLTSGFSRATASDDWIFLPQFTADANKVYSFIFDVYLADTELPGGAVEVWIGDAPSKSAMKSVIIPSIALNKSNSWETYGGEFTANGDLAGKPLYIGIGVTSDKGILSPLRMYNIEVKESTTASIDGPEAVGNLSIARDAENQSTAVISFTMPTKTISGTAIPASATVSVKIEATGEGISNQTVTGKPGEAMTVRLTTGSINRLISLTPSYNNLTGLSKNCVSTLGLGLPGVVRNLRASYDQSNYGLRLDWDAPLTDVNGTPMGDEQLSYTVWTKNEESGDYEYAVQVNYPLSLATLHINEVDYLYNLEVAITATNSIGESPESASIVCQIGKPFTLPIDDDFNGDSFKYNPITYYVADKYENSKINWGNPSKGNWGLSGDMISIEGDVLCGVPSEAGAFSRIDLPKVSSDGFSNVALQLNIWTGSDAAKTTISGSYPIDEPNVWEGVTYYPLGVKEISTIPSGSGWQLVTVDFPEEFADQPWINAIIESEYSSLSNRFILAGYTLTGTNSVGEIETLYGSVFGSEGLIKVTGYDNETVYVYSLDGSLVKSAKVTDNVCDIPVDGGLYLVKVANRSAKVVVK